MSERAEALADHLEVVRTAYDKLVEMHGQRGRKLRAAESRIRRAVEALKEYGDWPEDHLAGHALAILEGKDE